MTRHVTPLQVLAPAAACAALLTACATDTGGASARGEESPVPPARKAAERPAGPASRPKGPRKEPPAFVIELAELSAGSFSVRVPTGEYEAPPGGAPNYAVPGPIAAFKGPDEEWRGRGYLETYPRLLKFGGKVEGARAELVYTFEEDKSYKVRLEARDGAILMDEEAKLGPRNLYVFDCHYGGWEPTSGFALDMTGDSHAFLYLPCFYDKPEVTMNPVAQAAAAREKGEEPEALPGAVAVVSADAAKKDVAGFWVRDVAGWRKGETMGIQLWQRRQLPGDPGSRHFLGPETKSDSTPNPRTRPLLGESLYEGHVTMEMSLGTGTRRLGFAVASKVSGDDEGEAKDDVPEAFKKIVRANR